MIRKDNIRINVTISKSLNDELKEIALYEGTSVSGLVYKIIKYYIKNKKNISLD